MKASWTGVRLPSSPPKAYWLARVNSRIVPDTQYASDGDAWFRQGEITKEATRELTDVISKTNINANDEVYALAA